jgi:hypothetical protein
MPTFKFKPDRKAKMKMLNSLGGGNILSQRVGKELAKQVAKRIDKGTFLSQLESTWLVVLSQSSGAVDLDSEVQKMKDRLKRSGYEGVFKSAKVTEEDLINTLKGAIEKAGRKTKETDKTTVGEVKVIE